MSKWFRSEEMEYISIIVNEDAAHDCLADLGKLGVLQFTDVSYQRHLLLYCILFSMLLIKHILPSVPSHTEFFLIKTFFSLIFIE